MKKFYFSMLIGLMAGLFSSNSVMAQVNWPNTYTVVAQYEDVQNGNAVKDDTFTMTIIKDGSDYIISEFCGYTDLMYGGLLASVDKSDSKKLNVPSDKLLMTSTDEERGQGIMKYLELRDADGKKGTMVLTSLGGNKFSLTPFSLVQTQRQSTEEKILRRYTTITSVTVNGGGGEPEEKTKWEKLYGLMSCSAFHIDSKTGTFMASDFRDDLQGGIYYSDDKGATWKKTKVADNNYIKFYETDEYIFALGYGARIARSDDGGHTWELLNYSRVIQGIVSEEDMDYTAAYDMVKVGNRIYVADYAGGVIYSEDYGETWKHTNDQIFLETVEGKSGVETIHNVLYGITEYKGHIFAMGLYYVYEYDAVKDTWKIVRDDSNLMAIHCTHNGKLYCGRSMPNDTYTQRFLEVTNDGVNWFASGRPDSEDNNVRAMGSNGKYIVVGLQSTGILYSPDDTETWYDMDKDGLPLRFPGNASLKDQKLTPMAIEFDNDYVYVAFFGDSPLTAPGVYRYPISEINAVGITDIDLSRPQDDAIYDLQGRKVSIMQKGIYIKNGHKFLNK